jgi:hypothetical protein
MFPTNPNKRSNPAACADAPARPLRWLALALLATLALVLAFAAKADAAYISRSSTFQCGTSSVVVYFPELYTGGGNETVSYSPDLWKYTSAGWIPWNTTKPWYSATVGPNAIYTINGYKWWLGQTPYRNVPFNGLSSGYYAVKGYFYNGSSHWATVTGTQTSSCYVR